MSMQIKRGTTEGWSLGPELVEFDKFKINGSDSTIHCEGNRARVYLGTTSATDFNLSGSKSLGIWLVAPGDLELDPGCYKIAVSCKANDSSSSSTEYGVNCYDENRNLLSDIDTNRSLAFHVADGESTFFVPADTVLKICISLFWSENVQKCDRTITLSIRKINDYGELLPGQLGCEYFDDFGSCAIKIGTQNAQGTSSKWSDLTYLGQVLPASMYGTELPATGVPGQIFYKKA